jgi:hypothetical protein
MSRARRLASAVVAASLAVGGLSACRTGSTTAVYGDAPISEQKVQEIWDKERAVLTEQARVEAAAAEKAQREEEQKRRDKGEAVTPAPTVTAPPLKMPYSRVDLVHAMVTRDLYGRVAQQRGVTLPANLPIDEVAAQRKLPVGTEFAELTIENVALHQFMMEAALASPTATRPTEADVQRVYEELKAAGQTQPGADYAAFKQTLTEQQNALIAVAAGLRNDVQKVATELGVDVHPRYAPFQVTLLSSGVEGDANGLISTDFGDYEPLPVTDLR